MKLRTEKGKLAAHPPEGYLCRNGISLAICRAPAGRVSDKFHMPLAAHPPEGYLCHKWHIACDMPRASGSRQRQISYAAGCASPRRVYLCGSTATT